MKILQIAPRMPFPLTDGGAIGIYNITKFLAAAGHKVTLVTYPLDTKEATDEAVRDISQFADIRLVSRPLPPRWLVLARSMFRGPYPIERRMMSEMTSLLRRVASEKTYDILHVDHAHMGRYGLMLKREFDLPAVLREHNFESQIYRRFASTTSNPIKRWIARMHGERLLREETYFLKSFDAIAAISTEDASLIRGVAPNAKVEVIPAGVDTGIFTPTDPALELPNSILWVGGTSWDPNRDALEYFLDSVFPSILANNPSAQLDIVGEGTESVASRVAKWPNSVRIHGRVPDVRDYLRTSAVLVVPLRIGGGMRLKLVEFFAAGKAVVSTTIGAEGNVARNNEHLLIRDDPSAFALAVVELLANRQRRTELGAAARELALEVYGWQSIAERFVQLYERVLLEKSRV